MSLAGSGFALRGYIQEQFPGSTANTLVPPGEVRHVHSLGPYSYLAGEWNGLRIPVGTEAEWIMQRFNIPVGEYRQMAHQLNPVHFDAEGWVQLAKANGMKYLIFTAKHPDGFALYHTEVGRYNIVDWTQFKRDSVQELSTVGRNQGFRFVFTTQTMKIGRIRTVSAIHGITNDRRRILPATWSGSPSHSYASC